MSNFLAPAMVTATLKHLLAENTTTVTQPKPSIEIARPDNPGDEEGSASRITIYLYEVAPNAALRNINEPVRDGDGQPRRRPQVALDLRYLFSFYGDPEKLEPERLLGLTVSLLNAQPVLSAGLVKAAIDKFKLDDGLEFLENADLADQGEVVRLVPHTLGLEELSKLWSVFFQCKHALSVAYQASVVLIESEITPRSPLPVGARNLYAMPFRQPFIDRVGLPREGETGGPVDGPVVAGSKIVIAGRQLGGAASQVSFRGGDPIDPLVSGETRIVATLPLSLRAGPCGVQVVQPFMIGTPPSRHRGVESNAFPFLLRPRITAVDASQVAGNAKMTVTLSPEVGARQRVLLLLNETTGGSPRSFTFMSPSRSADDTQVEFDVPGLGSGTYFARVQVDGAESPLLADPDVLSPTHGQLIPQVVVP